MKTVYLILTIVFLCSSNSVFAQFHQTTYDWQAKMQRKINYPFYDGPKDNKSIKKKKSIVPTVDIQLAIEVVTDDVTGKTTARWEDGSVFVGFTYYGQINGEGTITFADGSKYHGGWRSDRFHGVGTMEYADGGKYIGQWSWGKPHGQGTIIEANGVKITAKFDDGIPRGKCIIQDVDGRLYTGRWSSGILREKSIKPLDEKK